MDIRESGRRIRLGVLGAGVALGALTMTSAFARDDSGNAFNLRADGEGVGVSGDVRAALAGVAGAGDADWVSRVRGGYDYHSDGDSRFWAETIQPLHQTEHTAVFAQGRLAQAHDDQTLNLGAGYRMLSPDAHFLFGVNAFYDISAEEKHQRYSIGAEALGPFFSARANWYEGASGWKTLAPGITEKALGGWDMSLDSQAPYMPWLRVGARYYEWRGETAADAEGLQGTLSADLTSQVQFVAAYAGEDDPEGDYYVGLRLRLSGDGRKPTAMRQFWSSLPLEGRELQGHMLDFVERENRIITETQGGQYASGVITVSRSE